MSRYYHFALRSILTQDRNGTFSGGDRFTTYTAIPSYVSTDGNVFYLDTDSTALSFFDFRKPDAVTLRYDALQVTGAFVKAADMFEAVERLTEYTGRMPTLPDWVDSGAILGIQGGQDKVNGIVQHGLELDCPIAGVWLQDWSGTRKLKECNRNTLCSPPNLQTCKKGLTSTYHDCGGIGRTIRCCTQSGRSLCRICGPIIM